ncbi:DUF1810 family protein [Bradyrhizobium jicamae]|uniref:DUF1810 family protein n=1 Tax=Bradyrhizobium jicamae TaxID=280332 RepID=A0ABS5FAI2_9BRAD|nr:DUF1810 family protein [Bradyrhizobium jicamae]MBR0793792.1 DUF1810 family protein [Bradyrhizobium jicamae]MBR0933435.1 DUF1810 family protein [Bradyrhizobium jicamae]
MTLPRCKELADISAGIPRNDAGLQEGFCTNLFHRFSNAFFVGRATWATITAELYEGRKETHWIWFIFLQIEKLGRSSTARKHAIGLWAEAAACEAHPTLGSRLMECTELVLAIRA